MMEWTGRRVLTHEGYRMLPSTTVRHPDGDEFVVYDVDAIFPDRNRNWTRPLTDISGFAWHHDAVAFSGADADFDGHTSDEEFTRLRAIYNHHVAQGWNGIGYHCVGGLEDRLYVPRQDVLDTHRAHVSMSRASGAYRFPALGTPVWNHQLIGFCTMGNYSDRKLPDGTPVGPTDDRPPLPAIKGADAWMRAVTTLLGRPMTLHPHKYYQHKECPGDWTTPDSWDGFTYEPAPPQGVTKQELQAVSAMVGQGLSRLSAAQAELDRLIGRAS